MESMFTYELEYCDLHHALVEIRWLVFYDLYGNHFVRLHVLTLDHLAKRSLSQNIQNKVSVTNIRTQIANKVSGPHLCPSSVPNQSFT
jgi:hypothetical protein